MSDLLLAVGGVGLVSSRVDGQFHGKMFLSLSFKSCFSLSHALFISLFLTLSYFPNLVVFQVLLKLFDPSRHPHARHPPSIRLQLGTISMSESRQDDFFFNVQTSSDLFRRMLQNLNQNPASNFHLGGAVFQCHHRPPVAANGY